MALSFLPAISCQFVFAQDSQNAQGSVEERPQKNSGIPEDFQSQEAPPSQEEEYVPPFAPSITPQQFRPPDSQFIVDPRYNQQYNPQYNQQFRQPQEPGAPVLQGGANFNTVDKTQARKPLPAKAETNAPLEAKIEKEGKPEKGHGFLKALLGLKDTKSYGPAVRPPWMPLHAYTNDAMVAPYHNMDIFWWDKRPMPDKSQWVRLSNSVSRYWRGFVAEPCMIFVEPLQTAPGNFIFHGRARGSPRGWLQVTGLCDDHGFPLYRYWLDQR
ncbi:MAG: hypothetical protein K8F91_18310 [Candidatus Obscuribacterales bacterium]|nr:hypothetical protein [Candidatus Obscuribacterales bacterium]